MQERTRTSCLVVLIQYAIEASLLETTATLQLLLKFIVVITARRRTVRERNTDT